MPSLDTLDYSLDAAGLDQVPSVPELHTGIPEQQREESGQAEVVAAPISVANYSPMARFVIRAVSLFDRLRGSR